MPIREPFTKLILSSISFNSDGFDMFKSPHRIICISIFSFGYIKLSLISEDIEVNVNNNFIIRAFNVPHRNELSETVGYRIIGKQKSAIYIPDIDSWGGFEENLFELINENDILFLDGTFYIKSEIQLRDVSNIPHPEIIDTMKKLSNLSSSYKKRVHFIHLNHTNDVLRQKSDEYNSVIDNNFSLAKENQIFEI